MLIPPFFMGGNKKTECFPSSCAQLQVSQTVSQTDSQSVNQSVRAILLFYQNPSCKRVMQRHSEILFGDVCLSILVRVSSNCSVIQHSSGLPASPATC